MATIPALTHDTIIRIPGSEPFDMIKVGTHAGYNPGGGPLREGEDAVWTTKASPCLTNAPAEVKAKQRAKEQAAFDAAPLLTHGMRVSIDGQLYSVRINGVRFSDPVAFVRIP